MEVLQQINPGTAVLIGVGLCALCLVLPVIFSGLHFAAVLIDGVGHLVSLIFGVISGGPLHWCGCLVAIGGCGLIAATVWLIATGLANCATYSTNFCALFGR